MLKLYNSLTQKKERFTPLVPGQVSMYTCGPTVYARVHIGNLFSFVFADTLYRWLRYGEGYNVKWVMNITDIDDKTIQGAKKYFPDLHPNESLVLFTREYEQYFKEDIVSLSIHEVSMFLRATDTIDIQQNLIRSIMQSGHAYVQDGSVYFSLNAYRKSGHTYGNLVDIPDNQSTSSIDNDDYTKDSISDFVLWKAAKDGEPVFEFLLNNESLPGRPGWHLECSAMEYDSLGLPFDIHTGGIDLKFPHHENEIAQSCSGYGCMPNQFFMHNGHLLINGEKMSKSLKNDYTLEDLVNKGFSLQSIRFAFVAQHYRKDSSLMFEAFLSAKKHRDMLKTIRNDESFLFSMSVQEVRQLITDAMRDDLNTPKAFSFLLGLRKQGDISWNQKEKHAFFIWIDNIFGIDTSQEEIENDVLLLAERRWEAKKNKDYALADELRVKIEKRGYRMKDGKETFALEKESGD